MPVARRRDPVPLDDPAESVVKRGKPGGIDGRVLDEGDRLGVADHAHQERKPGLADLPEVVLAGIDESFANAQDARPALEFPGQVVGPLGQLLRRVGVELGGQNGRGPPVGEVQMLGERRVLGRQVEDHPVEHLDGDRTGLDDLGQAIEGRRDRRERQHDEPLGGRQRHDLELGRGDDRQRPFRADDQLRQVELPGLVVPAGGPHRQTRARTRRGCSR